jgi:penicillin-binding protein 1A
LLAGVWVGCDDRFIRLNKNDTRGYGGTAARPIWESFYKKVYADKKLGIDRDARFSKPDDLELEMNSADPLNLLDAIPPPAAEGEDQGVGNESDFEIIKTREYIGPESKPVTDDKEKKSKKDTTDNQAPAVRSVITTGRKKKKGIFNKILERKIREIDKSHFQSLISLYQRVNLVCFSSELWIKYHFLIFFFTKKSNSTRQLG